MSFAKTQKLMETLMRRAESGCDYRAVYGSEKWQKRLFAIRGPGNSDGDAEATVDEHVAFNCTKREAAGFHLPEVRLYSFEINKDKKVYVRDSKQFKNNRESSARSFSANSVADANPVAVDTAGSTNSRQGPSSHVI